MWRNLLLFAVLGLVVFCTVCGCGVTSPAGEASSSPPDASVSSSTEGVTRLGLQYNGALASATASERVDISAPILPDTRVLYGYEGSAYPATQAERESVARQASLSYEMLLAACAPLYPGITLEEDGAALTQEALAQNYELVAQCSYEQYWSKPYWIPQLVDDVEICELVLGEGWRLIAEADVAAMTKDDFQYFADTLQTAAASVTFWGGFYFSLTVYARAADGHLATASLDPASAGMIEGSWDPLGHNEGATALRCIRRGPGQTR